MQEAFLTWQTSNQACLMAAVGELRSELEAYARRVGITVSEQPLRPPDAAVRAAMTAPPAYEILSARLGLGIFEQKLLLLCAGIELDSSLATLVGMLRGNAQLPLPGFGLAMAAFPDAHWSALTPNAPLRYHKLLRVLDETILTRSPLAIDEQILHYLAGIPMLDSRLSQHLEAVSPPDYSVPSQEQLVASLASACRAGTGHSPIICLEGPEGGKPGIAAAAAANQELTLFELALQGLPANRSELHDWIRIWNRESQLQGYALFIDCVPTDTTDRLLVPNLQLVLETCASPVFIAAEGWIPKTARAQLRAEVAKPTTPEQTALWQDALGDRARVLNGKLDNIVSQFSLSTGAIVEIAAELSAVDLHAAADETGDRLWKLCRRRSRPAIDALAQRILPVATMDDLVLPDAQKDVLREIAVQVRNRRIVYGDWGFGPAGTRGLGITAMFSGESGTGKTMAAEALANALQLDLYRIDLSQVVNKYIGETEKNLKRIFDAADDGGAILLFDEADALFGKRSEVKDSHDRYGNIEVSYLLQRMEVYRGLAILTTNLKSALDKAFMRRIRFVVQFPFPGAVQRNEIWRRIFPARAPLATLDYEKLSKLSVPGGNIRNIAINAAFMAAEEQSPVGMPQILRAARLEYGKLEKPMNSIESDHL